MNFEEVKEAFPIGCEVELIDNKGENYISFQLGTRGKVNSYYYQGVGDVLLNVSWENNKYPSGTYFHWRFRVIDVAPEVAPVFDLKVANTEPSATECASCGGKLKDPGMGPRFKYCPICEP